MIKQVIVYRRDLAMRKGKIAAQVAHASMRAVLHTMVPAERVVVVTDGVSRELPAETTAVLAMGPEMAAWVKGRFKKVVLSVDDEAALLRVHELALAAGLPTALIRDAGLTEFGGVPMLTTCAVGPALPEAIDAITGPEGAVATKLA